MADFRHTKGTKNSFHDNGRRSGENCALET